MVAGGAGGAPFWTRRNPGGDDSKTSLCNDETLESKQTWPPRRLWTLKSLLDSRRPATVWELDNFSRARDLAD